MMQFPIFPYKTKLCFTPLIDYIREKQGSNNKAISSMAEQTMELLKNAPELFEPIEDLTIIEKNRELVEMMMGFIFSPTEIDREIIAASTPFHPNTFFSSPSWTYMLETHEQKLMQNMTLEEMTRMKLINANNLVMKHIYNQDSPTKYHTIFTIPDIETGLQKYYRVNIISDFARAIPLNKVKKLKEKDFKLLKHEFQNIDLWKEYVPYENFEIQGIVAIKLIDVTAEEAISALKNDLLRKDSITSPTRFPQVQQKLRELFQLHDLKLGIVLFDWDQKKEGPSGPKIWNSIINKEEFDTLKPEDFENCAYHKMMESQEPMVVEDLREYEGKTAVEEILLNKGVRNMLLAPLEDDGKCLGSLELGSPNPGALDATAVFLLKEIMPIFAVAARRSLEERDNEVQAYIKEDYTAIHPTVEWRFQQAATRKLEMERKGQRVENEPIVFDHVYPLYGLADIRGSSTARSTAIQGDLIEQLLHAEELLALIYSKKPLPIVQEVIYRLRKYFDNISANMGSGDEQNVLFYLESTVEPLFKHFLEIKLISKKDSSLYFGALDPNLGIVYKKRKAFEESVTMINDTISHYMDEQQNEVQALFPHYYERYKTDGVEYNIYAGQSLVQSEVYDPIYLRNLRLWQLSATAQITRISVQLKESLPLPLDTAQLILVHSTPIAIRFREDEKQFDVDGAYNIRYEIVKKRIDKARIKGTKERLTQPEMIAIVYSQDREATEYYEYIEYLQHQGVLETQIEELELEPLQGANGLKALRVKVKTEAADNQLPQRNVPHKIAEHA